MKYLAKYFPRNGKWGWVLMAFVIFAYDVIAMSLSELEKKNNPDMEDFLGEVYETLTGCFHRNHSTLRGKVLNCLVIFIIVKHLAAPEFLKKADPIGLIGLLVRIASRK